MTSTLTDADRINQWRIFAREVMAEHCVRVGREDAAETWRAVVDRFADKLEVDTLEPASSALARREVLGNLRVGLSELPQPDDDTSIPGATRAFRLTFVELVKLGFCDAFLPGLHRPERS